MGEGICTVQELKQRMDQGDGPVVVDVRTAEELALAAFPFEVLHVPLNQLQERLPELQRFAGRELIIACHHGFRSEMARGFLLRNGLPTVRNLQGGIDAYARLVDAAVPRY
jgi:adenylyltransferase/sulfurtransferase